MTIERFEPGARMSQGVAYGDTVYLAGQVAADTVGTGVTAQTQAILEQIERLLVAAGSGKERILMATIYLADMGTFAEMNAAWDAWVSKENPPGRATVEARLAGPEYLVEIVVVAARALHVRFGPLTRAVLCAGVLFASGPSRAEGPARVVNIYNWSDYIDPKVLDAFTRETGIKVVYDTYDNNEILETKLLAGQSGYDVVVPSGPFLQRLIRAGAFQPLDRAKLKNLGNVWPEIAGRLSVYDPGNVYAVDYMWGTTGLGINLGLVRERLGANAALNTWNLVLNPANANRLKDCGIMMLDSPEDLIPSLAPTLGLKSDTRRWEDISQVTDALYKVRGAVRKFHSSEYIQALASGDICVAIGYSGDVLQAKRRAVEAKNGVEIGYVIPREGTLMWFDAFAIPKDAPHATEALAFIDYMLRPEVAAANTNFVAYASGNLPAKKFIKSEILSNTGIYPDEATMPRLSVNTAWDDRTQKFVTRLWTRVRTGR